VGELTEVGGSLRIPAAYSGCLGLKPALGRWPGAGQRPVAKGFEGVRPVVGPMARNVDDLTFASKSMIDALVENIANHDYVQVENVVPLPWREPNLPKRMRIGYWLDDGVVRSCPAVRRAVQEVATALEKEGHELVLWQPPNVAEALKIFVALLSFDGFKQLLANIGRDPMEPAMYLVTLGPRLPKFARWLVNNLVHYLAKDPVFASVFCERLPVLA
jgi:Asp-tRNA(Asn)/Glu-tRNA(Gln) amidotransferase A subunit family amidase